MASLRSATAALLGGVVGIVAVTGATLVGCSGDDNVADSGAADTGSDSTADTGSPDGGGGDAKGGDGGGGDAKGDAGGDATMMTDGGGGDAAHPDAADAGHDGSVDAPPGDAAGDAGDAQVDAGPNALQRYAAAYAQAFCTQNLQCCTGYPNSVDVAKCVAQNQTQGFENTLPLDPLAYTRGHLQLNADAGAGCIAALPTIQCNTTVTAAQWAAIANAYFGVFTGNIAVNAGGCVSSFECVAGAFCNFLLDGGAIANGDAAATPTGVCTAISAANGPCVLGATPNASDQCQTATAQPTAFCNALLTLSDAGTCQGLLPDDAGCADPNGILYDLACTSELCAGGASGTSCGGGFPFDNTNNFCSQYALDGGTD